jgi:aspartyl-tRNA(Asn)/glutamyl-tRNA(Gln) amidotransferase subunit A
MTSELYDLTIHEAAELLARRELSSQELTRACLERISRLEPQLNAFITVTVHQALEQAEAADLAFKAGEANSPLCGVPMALKDVIVTEGVATTAGSRILGGDDRRRYIPPYSATVAGKLRSLGAVLLGKANMDEFAMGSSNENSAYGAAHNPWDVSRVPGGSSGGSAAATAAREALYTLGSDTGGSIRQPAAFVGCVGLKPSYGRVSRYGLIAFGSSLDQIGPLTKDVRDAALVMEQIAGHDPCDSTSLDAPVPQYAAELGGDLRGVRVGVAREYFVEGLDAGVKATVEAAIKQLEALGANIAEVSLPHTDYGLAAYYIIAPAEASANLARFDGVKYGYSHPADSILDSYMQTREQGFGAEVKRRIMLGAYALSAGYYDAYYLKAQKVRTLIKRDYEEAFKQVDVIAGPVTPTTAFKIGEKVADPLTMYLNDVYTIPGNLAGICGISVPCGFSNDLPVGLHLQGPVLGEEAILKVAYAYEQATDWHKQWPEL